MFHKPNSPAPVTFEKGGGSYNVDVTTYVSTDKRCMALEKASRNNSEMRAQLMNFGDDSLYDVVTQIDTNGNEIVSQEANDIASNGRTNVIYADKLDIHDTVKERTEIIEREAVKNINAHLESEQQAIKYAAHAKKNMKNQPDKKAD